MTVAPGYGNQLLNLRQTSAELREHFGPPRKRRKTGSFREYWFYPDQHFDCIVSMRSGRVLSFFLHPGTRLVEPEVFETGEDLVRRTYSSPKVEGGGKTLLTGNYLGRWYSYDEGIGFDFDKEGKLQTISVFASKQKARPKPHVMSATHAPHPERMAAMRLSGKS